MGEKPVKDKRRGSRRKWLEPSHNDGLIPVRDTEEEGLNRKRPALQCNSEKQA